MIDKEFPLFPTLSEEAQKEAQELLELFKTRMKKVADEVIGDLYADVVPYIESDSWSNFRNELLAGFQDYSNSKIQGQYDFSKIRQAIYRLHRDEIVADLNQDLVEEVKRLKEEIERMERTRFGGS